jgi:hypothetical protein
MLTDYAAIAEIIASIAVIFSLLFVGFQVRDSNRQARANAIQDAASSEIQMSTVLAEHSETWEKAVSGEPFEEKSGLRKAIHLFNILMSDSENRFYQYRQGYLKDQTWQSRLRTLEASSNLPIFNHWRNSLSGQNKSDDFLAMLDEVCRNNQTGS